MEYNYRDNETKEETMKEASGQSCTNEDFHVFFCQASLIALKMLYQIFFTRNKKQSFYIKLRLYTSESIESNVR